MAFMDSIDVSKPDGSTERVSVLDNYQREHRDANVNTWGVEHYTTGEHKISRGATGSRPTSPKTGQLYVNTTTKNLEIWDGLAWQDVFTSPTVTYDRIEVNKTANQTISAGVATLIQWDASDFNVGSMWTASNPTVITIPTTGHYVGGGNVYITLATTVAATSAAITLNMLKNAVTDRNLWGLQLTRDWTSGEVLWLQFAAMPTKLTIADEITLQLTCTLADDITVLGAKVSTYFELHRLP